MVRSYFVLGAFCAIVLTSCGDAPGGEKLPPGTTLFTLLEPSETGLDFFNHLQETKEINYVSCLNCYNGGGVAVGDVDNDGDLDVFFTGQQVPSRLYRNVGEFQFEDMTDEAGIVWPGGWATGVTMVDINRDGWLDIYVCRSLKFEKREDRRNLLYINQGDGTFKEEAQSYGIDDPGFSTHANFFDYDRDGDLDMYLMARPSAEVPLTYSRTERVRLRQDPDVRDKLFRNNGDNTFSDVSAEAGIVNYAYGLSCTVADINNDGWPDIYVANDFIETDFIYINNGDGTFTNRIEEMFAHISNFSMGSDISDFNNDGLLDVCVVDMVAEDHYRNKVLMGAMDSETFWMALDSGYHYQYMANMLQVNNGNGTFSEIGQMAGISKTDWSWAVLFGDYDNDGLKDLFVSNGILRDVRHNDYIPVLQKAFTDAERRFTKRNFELLLESPSTRIKNYGYHNNGDYTFAKKTHEWGLDRASFSNGAVYVDIDKDGDLDLITNNVNDTAFVYRNNARQLYDNDYIRFDLRDAKGSPEVYGARVILDFADGEMQMQELTNVRGYLSMPELVLHFGLGKDHKPTKATIIWPNGTYQTIDSPAPNQVHKVQPAPDAKPWDYTRHNNTEPMVREIDPSRRGLNAMHHETPYDDFRTEILLPHRMSQHGPGVAVGDVDGNGTDDFYLGGASGYPGTLRLQGLDGNFEQKSVAAFDRDASYEDLGVLFFDADGDADLDLYVVSGSNEFESDSPMLQDRLYLGDGKGGFERARGALPEMISSGSCVVAGDYDGDGDLDLFVGGRVIPNAYPRPAHSWLLRNDGGKFTDVTEEVSPELRAPGLVTAAVWTDYDANGSLDLIVVGEWMPISIFKNVDGKLMSMVQNFKMDSTAGWWNSIVVGDFDNDGDNDYVIGNLGKNTKFKAEPDKPTHVYYNDFDTNGVGDIVLAYQKDAEVCYPVRGRECSSEQMPMLTKKFPTYDTWGRATLQDVYGEEMLQKSLHLQSFGMASVYVENQGNGRFDIRKLPMRAQFAPIYGMNVIDFNGDSNLDVVVVGNNYGAEVETIRYDASIGLVLLGDGKGNFSDMPVMESGLFVHGDAKAAVSLNDAATGNPLMLVTHNNSSPQLFEFLSTPETRLEVTPGSNEYYAVMHFADGSKRRVEAPYGSGYLSGSSRRFYVPANVSSVTIGDFSGGEREVAAEMLSRVSGR